jgi:predicted RNase H-like HicB family nuclease
MKTYRVRVIQGDDGWLVAEGVNLRGLVTQGRDLNELAFMIRDAIEMLTETTRFSVELILPATFKVAAARGRARTAKKTRRRAA